MACKNCGIDNIIKYYAKEFCSKSCFVKFRHKNKTFGMYGLTGRSNGFRQNIGKSYEEIYGKEKGKEQRIKRSESGKKNVSNVLEVGKNTRFEKGHKNLCPAGGVGASKISVAQTKNKEQRSKHLRKLILENKFTPMWCSGKYKS